MKSCFDYYLIINLRKITNKKCQNKSSRNIHRLANCLQFATFSLVKSNSTRCQPKDCQAPKLSNSFRRCKSPQFSSLLHRNYREKSTINRGIFTLRDRL